MVGRLTLSRIPVSAVVPVGIAGVWVLRLLRSFRRLEHCRDSSGVNPIEVATKDKESGFHRTEHGIEDLPGTCSFHTVHAFVISDTPAFSWPSKWEDTPGLPAALSKALKASAPKGGGAQTAKAKVKLTAASASSAAGLYDQAGDILVFPERIRVRGCRSEDASALAAWLLAGAPKDSVPSLVHEPISRRQHQLFVCAHTQRDKRCGVIGPAIVDVLTSELVRRDLTHVPVRMCSHIGGHKYAGNVILFAQGEGHWYGYVDARAAVRIVDEHIVGGKPLIEPKLWRGQLGLTEEAQRSRCDQCQGCSSSRQAPLPQIPATASAEAGATLLSVAEEEEEGGDGRASKVESS